MEKYFNEDLSPKNKEYIVRQKLSKEIKSVRKSNGLTQKEFADIIGLDGGKTCISLIENNKKIMPSSYMPMIADLANRSVESFYSRPNIREYGNVLFNCLQNMGYQDEDTQKTLEFIQTLIDKAIDNIGSAKLFDYLFSVLRNAALLEDNKDNIVQEIILIERTSYNENISRFEKYIEMMNNKDNE